MKKGAFMGLGIIISTIIIIALLLVMSMFIDTISLQSMISIKDAENNAMCSSVLENIVGSEYSKLGDDSDRFTFLKQEFQKSFSRETTYFGFQNLLERNQELEQNFRIRVRVMSSNPASVRETITEEAGQGYEPKCSTTVYSPSGKESMIILFQQIGLSVSLG